MSQAGCCHLAVCCRAEASGVTRGDASAPAAATRSSSISTGVVGTTEVVSPDDIFGGSYIAPVSEYQGGHWLSHAVDPLASACCHPARQDAATMHVMVYRWHVSAMPGGLLRCTASNIHCQHVASPVKPQKLAMTRHT
jgi:hypothetical protein